MSYMLSWKGNAIIKYHELNVSNILSTKLAIGVTVHWRTSEQPKIA